MHTKNPIKEITRGGGGGWGYFINARKNGNQSKAPDKKPSGQKPPGRKPTDNKPPRIIEEIIAKYAVDANLSTNPK